ncbi:hypothetical protein [Pseudomonas sp. NCCP-436]|uniref:hypothetical protein n=1 Tax=Pseudomonas sp. NCCP-436 TaxID=2842481 RepID=UPI001C7EF054|nr:hypothetical protein [Pseudomonas sp. NCCP-436]GIZ11057.1 hypothetical protein NCCP436_04730 [Pseudomonas sp. NCCP-436]
MSRYEIAFSGELVPGAQPETVKANLARLFQADAQRIAMLFSGRRVVIKSNLDEAAAEKYRATLERAGARVAVVNLDPPVEEIELAPPPAAPATPAVVPTPPAALKVVPRDEYMAAFSEVQAPDFGIAPVGSDLQDARSEVPPPMLDLSGLSLAPVGSDMGQARGEAAPPPPDISHLRLQE